MRNLDLTVGIATRDRSDLLIKVLQNVNMQAKANNCLLCVLLRNDGGAFSRSFFKKIKNHDHLSIEVLGSDQRGAGLASCRNDIISKTKTKFLTFLDDDDIWPPGHLKKFLIPAVGKKHGADIILGYNDPIIKMSDKLISSEQFVQEFYSPPVGSQVFDMQIRSLLRYDEHIDSGVDHDLFFGLYNKNVGIKLIYAKNIIALTSLNDNRITTKFDIRVLKIANAIKVWSGRCEDLPGSYWVDLQVRYDRQIGYKKFRAAIQRRDLVYILVNLFNSNFAYLLSDIFYRCLGFRIGKRLI